MASKMAIRIGCLASLTIFWFMSMNFHQFATHALESKDLVIFTVATEQTDGFQQFMRSAKKYGLDNIKVLGMGQEWKGGDVARFAGGGFKVNLLVDAMEEYKDDEDKVIMFVDSYDVVFTAGPKEILKSFDKMDARVVFAAEDFCWPDKTLVDKYPMVKVHEKRYLNSGGFIGYASELYKILTSKTIGNLDDDQLFYTHAFLDHKDSLSIKLDTRSEIFQNLNGALDEVSLKFKGSKSFLYNEQSGNSPHVVHGNGPIKVQFNRLANYLADRWTPVSGCQFCKEDTISLTDVNPEDYPQVLLGFFLEHPTPFAEEALEKIGSLNYPKAKIDLYVHYADELHAPHVSSFMDKYAMDYNSVKLIEPADNVDDWSARNKALELCQEKDCQYFFTVEGEAQFNDENVLTTLIERNRSVIAPLLVRQGKSWSNFWGALSSTGYYMRSDDYMDIVHRNKRGQWNVPYITMAYLIQAHRIPLLLGGYIDGDMDSDMAICKRMREKGIFMYLDNQEDYGIQVNSDDYDTTHLHNDLWTIFSNKNMWEKKYIHENYSKNLLPETEVDQPCPDVYWFPIVSDTFCRHLIEEFEHFGKWSGGGHDDPRLSGGYENVPTVDIHTNQIDWEKHWLEFLKEYVGPVNSKVFTGYYTDARAIMNFIVRYRPGEQDRLRPHHDASTYSINIALNTPELDYEGGGTKFLRYNCSVTKSRRGWVLMHPGRLTHYHEGLPTTKGTRYIMISFVDP